MSDAIVGIDVGPVGEWLRANVAGAQGPFSYVQIAGGRSNLTYRVDDASGATFVLRRPPLGHVLATAHDMGREHRIISAVGRTDVPVAPALGFCDDPAVNGAPFYVMGYVDGTVLDSPPAAEALSVEARRTAAHDLVDVLTRLHAVDPDAIGLGELGRKSGYLERQLKRWSTQWEQSKTRELPVMEEVRDRLAATMPEQRYTGIVHGDYRLGNCLVDAGSGHLRAVLDWELCTLGDTMADIGYLLVHWSDPGQTPRVAQNDPSGAEGFPSRREMLDRYSAATGRDLTGVGYYEAFSCWRLACIFEGVLKRYLVGAMGSAEGMDFDESGVRVRALAERALRALDR